MDSFFLDLGISVILSVLKEAVKNPAKKASLRKAMLKIYTQIGVVFGADAEFEKAAAEVAKRG